MCVCVCVCLRERKREREREREKMRYLWIKLDKRECCNVSKVFSFSKLFLWISFEGQTYKQRLARVVC